MAPDKSIWHHTSLLEDIADRFASTGGAVEELEAIAGEAGVPCYVLLEILKDRGIPLRARRKGPEEDERLGLSLAESIRGNIREIAARIGPTESLSEDEAYGLAHRAASYFLSLYFVSGDYSEECVQLLCQLASVENDGLRRAGLQGLFPLLVERLSDAFNPDYSPLYDRMFAQVLQFCRGRAGGEALDRKLRELGLRTEQELLARTTQVKQLRRFDLREADTIRKVLVLSRVTLGADVAVSSVLLARVKHTFPHAEIVLLAHPKAEELFGGDSRVRIRELHYQRGGTLIDRLHSWLAAQETVEDEAQGQDLLIFDPDSRITQLGLLPLTADDSRYFFFESRAYGGVEPGPLGHLANHWLNRVFGTDEESWPYVSPRAPDMQFGAEVCGRLRAAGCGPLVAVNFGVGGNQLKRIEDPFEDALISRLIEQGATAILDRGFGEEEVSRVGAITTNLSSRGKKVIALAERQEAALPEFEAPSPDVVTWEGGIGKLAALIAHSDQYVGYDSAGQHIAAALGIPTVNVFAGYSHPRMPERWRPHGRAPVKLVQVDTLHRIESVDPNEVVERTIAGYEELRQERNGRERDDEP